MQRNGVRAEVADLDVEDRIDDVVVDRRQRGLFENQLSRTWGPNEVLSFASSDPPLTRSQQVRHSMRHGHHQLPRPGGITRLDPVQ
jgi:hypothetical protein